MDGWRYEGGEMESYWQRVHMESCRERGYCQDQAQQHVCMRDECIFKKDRVCACLGVLKSWVIIRNPTRERLVLRVVAVCVYFNFEFDKILEGSWWGKRIKKKKSKNKELTCETSDRFL